MIPESNELRFEVTTHCNYECIICPREKLTRKKEMMSYNTFKYLLDKIIRESTLYNIMTFPGFGEPMLDRSLDKKIVYAKEKGFKVLILTNASLLTYNRFKDLEDIGTDSIRVSMYGDSFESYRRMHGVKDGDLFRKVKDNLTEIASRKRSTELLLTYNVVDAVNDTDLQRFISYWKDRVDLLEVWRPHNLVDGKDYRLSQPEKMRTCGRPWNTPLQIQVDGTINMCCFDYDGKLLLGDLKTQTLKEIFESPMFKKILKHHTSGDFRGSGLICEDCDQRNADKSDVMIYNSKYDVAERVNQVSTTYRDVVSKEKQKMY